MAAIKAAGTSPEASIAVIEKMEEPGKKVAAAGNGRCNLSNTGCQDWEKTSGFFSTIGVFTRADSEGRIYPYSEDGRDVTAKLIQACLDRGVEILTRREVKKVENLVEGTAPGEGYSFRIEAEFNKPKAYRPTPEDDSMVIFAKKVLISTGGKSKPKLGTTGDGYKFAQSLGHSIKPVYPVLTGVEIEGAEELKSLSGIRQKAVVSLYKNESIIFQEKGEVQFTDYGVSGICIFDLSRFLEGMDLSSYLIEINFAPDFSKEEIAGFIRESKSHVATTLQSIIKRPIAENIPKESEKTFGSPNGENEGFGAESVAGMVVGFKIKPKSLRGWDMAQVTRGGVPLSEIKEDTCESLLVPGLYFSGEMIDVDFQCGGYNLQNAWTTGLRAGENIGKDLK